VSRVTITSHDIQSSFGLCAILSRKREGATFAVHVECKDPGGNQLLGDVNFTPRDDMTVDFRGGKKGSTCLGSSPPTLGTA